MPQIKRSVSPRPRANSIMPPKPIGQKTGIEHIFPRVNINYAYTEQDIVAILKAYFKKRGLNLLDPVTRIVVDGPNGLLCSPREMRTFSLGDSLSNLCSSNDACLNVLSEMIAAIIKLNQEQKEYDSPTFITEHNIFFPLNIIKFDDDVEAHWCLGSLKFNLVQHDSGFYIDDNVDLRIYDSHSTPVLPEHLAADHTNVYINGLAVAIKRVLTEFKMPDNLLTISTFPWEICKQPDKCSDGPIVVDIIMRFLDGEGLFQVAHGKWSLIQIAHLRNRHIDTLDDIGFTNRQLGFIQVNAVSPIVLKTRLLECLNNLDLNEKEIFFRLALTLVKSEDHYALNILMMWFKTHKEYLNRSGILGHFFNLDAGANHHPYFMWRSDGGKELLISTLKILCNLTPEAEELGLAAVELHRNGSADEGLIYSFVGRMAESSAVGMRGFERYKNSGFVGTFRHGERETGLELNFVPELGIYTMFHGQRDNDYKYTTGEIYCIVGDCIRNGDTDYYVLYEGRLAWGRFDGIGKVFIATKQTKTEYLFTWYRSGILDDSMYAVAAEEFSSIKNEIQLCLRGFGSQQELTALLAAEADDEPWPWPGAGDRARAAKLSLTLDPNCNNEVKLLRCDVVAQHLAFCKAITSPSATAATVAFSPAAMELSGNPTSVVQKVKAANSEPDPKRIHFDLLAPNSP